MRNSHHIALIVTTLMLTGTNAFAQRDGDRGGRGGGFSPEMLLDRMDENGNGRLDPDEIAGSRMPIGDMARNAGIDPSNGLSADDIGRVMKKMEEMRSQGGGMGGFGGDRGGRGGDRSSRGGRDGRGESDSAKAPEPPPRVTMDLQESYVAGDLNSDGQLELSEWLKWKSRAALAEFISLDQNIDGILTPREIANAATAQPVDLATIFPGVDPSALGASSGTPVASGTAKTDAGPRPAPDVVAATPAPVPTGSNATASMTEAPTSADVERHLATAKRFFKILDRDNDGRITDLEWQRSSRLRPKFEAAGANLSEPMSEEQFTGYYVKFSTSG